MANCLLCLGSNLGDRGAHLHAALAQLADLPQTQLVAHSSVRDTRPVGGPFQDFYLNAAATIETSLDPLILLRRLQLIEHSLGRVRTERWGPRTIDLDLLLYDELELDSPELTLPHPRMSFRRFVLEPAVEIAAEMVYPINGWTVGMLAEHSRRAPRYIVLSSSDGSHAKLLSSFEDVANVRVSRSRHRKKEELRTFEAELDSDTDGHPSQNHWTIFDRYVDGAPRLFGDEVAASADVRIPPALVVVWQLTSNRLESLEKFRRSKRRGPHLWIPGVSMEQARQEVIAAMAAME